MADPSDKKTTTLQQRIDSLRPHVEAARRRASEAETSKDAEERKEARSGSWGIGLGIATAVVVGLLIYNLTPPPDPVGCPNCNSHEESAVGLGMLAGLVSLVIWAPLTGLVFGSSESKRSDTRSAYYKAKGEYETLNKELTQLTGQLKEHEAKQAARAERGRLERVAKQNAKKYAGSRSGSSGTRRQEPRSGKGGQSTEGRSAGRGARSSITSGDRSVPGGEFDAWISADEKRALGREFGWICQLCLEPIDPTLSFDYRNPNPDRLAIDHITPRKHGGTDDIRNLQPTHQRCNAKKGGKRITNEEFRRRNEASQGMPASRGRPPESSRVPGRSGSQSKHREPSFSRPPSHPTVSRLRRNLVTARLSPLMRARAERFLNEDHPFGLLTECQRGHEFTLENTYFSERDGTIHRQCRTCRRR